MDLLNQNQNFYQHATLLLQMAIAVYAMIAHEVGCALKKTSGTPSTNFVNLWTFHSSLNAMSN
nr:MAG TPA: hypothetical protein [Caudoviricetes sp.]